MEVFLELSIVTLCLLARGCPCVPASIVGEFISIWARLVNLPVDALIVGWLDGSGLQDYVGWQAATSSSRTKPV